MWLSGNQAEELGWTFFDRKLGEIVKSPDFLRRGTDISDEMFETVVQNLLDLSVALTGRELAVRSYATTSADFKLSFRVRCTDPETQWLVQLARLPKYVWVVEVLERLKRRDRPVVAQIVVDASAPRDQQSEALILQLRNVIIVSEPRWHGQYVVGCRPIREMDSGRWADGEPKEAPSMSRAKWAIPVESMSGLF